MDAGLERGQGKMGNRKGAQRLREEQMEKAGRGGWCEDFIAWSNKSYLYYQGGPDGVGGEELEGTRFSCPCLGDKLAGSATCLWQGNL